MCAKSLQLCPTLFDPMDYSPPGSSVHRILQARILECVVMPSSRGSSRPRVKLKSLTSALVGGFFTTSATWEPLPKDVTLKSHHIKLHAFFFFPVENSVLSSGLPDCLSPEDSLSESSERLLQRGKGGSRMYGSFAIKTR